MTVVIRQEAKFSFMPEILAANIVVGPLPRVKTVALGELGNPEATCLSFDFLSPECSKKDFTQSPFFLSIKPIVETANESSTLILYKELSSTIRIAIVKVICNMYSLSLSSSQCFLFLINRSLQLKVSVDSVGWDNIVSQIIP